jgi:hypothetical protein
MELDEHWKHSTRRQVIKICGHLLDAQKAIRLATEHAKLAGNYSSTTQAIEGNIDALATGVLETVKLCGIAADEIKQTMLDPHATPAPIKGNMGVALTPYQRSLAREGIVFTTMPEYVATKAERKIPKLLTFTLRTPKKRHNRRKSPDNPPL